MMNVTELAPTVGEAVLVKSVAGIEITVTRLSETEWDFAQLGRHGVVGESTNVVVNEVINRH